jgi:hypothetical protein
MAGIPESRVMRLIINNIPQVVFGVPVTPGVTQVRLLVRAGTRIEILFSMMIALLADFCF